MAILAPEEFGRKLPPVGSPAPDRSVCGNDGKIRTGSLQLFLISQGLCPNNPSQRIPTGGAGGGSGIDTPAPIPIPIPIPTAKPPPPPPPPMDKVPKLPPLPPLPRAPLPPSVAPGAGPGTAAGGGGAAGGGIMLLIGLALLASFGRR